MIQLPAGFHLRRDTLARSVVVRRSWPVFLDLCVAGLLLACFYAVVQIARYWNSTPRTDFAISLSPHALPMYAFFSIVRIGFAYLLSLAFALIYGYIAAYTPRLEGLMLACLDILQSIPVLSFLPGVMLAMVALVPGHQLGIEMGAIILIFTGQAWNIAYSFYASLKAIPRELTEAARIYNFSPIQRFFHLELPFATIGLIWNSMVSVAGGWFFLMACEMFILGSRDFRLPGLGSYLQTAAANGDFRAITYGLLTMIAIIVATDQLLWRPLIAWSDKFKFEQTESSNRVSSPLLHLLQHSTAISHLRQRTLRPISEFFYRTSYKRRATQHQQPASDSTVQKVLRYVAAGLFIGIVLFAATHAIVLLREVQPRQIGMIFLGAGATFLRVFAALLIGSAWTIPAGVAIGLHPRLARIAQPLAQIAASVPATAVFPVLLLAIVKAGGGLGIGSIALILLGTQWYILFNVIAGAIAIPSDLREVGRLFRFSTVEKWKVIILPSIFPYLITGLVTASGGAWNASIVAEYFRLKNQTLSTFGLGAQISAATDAGQFPVLLWATIVMALIVVTINRLLWRPIYRIAETRYKLSA